MMREQYRFTINLLGTGLVVLFLAGCVMSPPPKSGFLGDYSTLHADKYGDKSLLWWEKEGFDWTRYKKLMIDPIAVYYHPEAKYREIRPNELKELTDYARNTIIEELQPDFQIVDQPGPDVLRVRAAITDIVPANPYSNILALAAIQVPIDMGGSAIEAEFLDSVSGVRVASMVDKKLGHPVFFWRSVTELGYTKGTFKSWAGELKTALKKNP
jgi:hypothetical protein